MEEEEGKGIVDSVGLCSGLKAVDLFTAEDKNFIEYDAGADSDSKKRTCPKHAKCFQ